MRKKLPSLMVLLLSGFATVACGGKDGPENPQSPSTNEKYPIALSTMRHYDPFFFTDHNSKMYYHVYPHYNQNGTPGGLELFESPDLHHWRKAGEAWVPSPYFLGNNDCWAPDLYEFRGKHYIFVTFSRIKDISNISHWNLDNFEIKAGTTVLVSDNGPAGPYRENAPKGILNVTPSEWMCIDGSLYVDKDSNPWMIYSGELTEFYDGRVYAQRMSDDLSSLIGEPHLLFSASEAPWVKDSGVQNGHTVYITDAPYVWRDEESGNLILTWSSNSSTGYAIGQTISRSGDILGPWEHEPQQLNTDAGGHSHIFKDLEGNLKISYHTTNWGSTDAVSTVKNITITDGKIDKIN